eukprot:Phypoly_transcript_13768.p1 GENE.Phypoly_transcript_13768~~Phypoly_transcript_13768.p1  ORF type:complete len:160 (+),score=20.86 Phypoly_transcript_13768:285-764(+)
MVYLYVVDRDSSFSFANQILNVAENSVKFSMAISNWPFARYSDQIKVTIQARESSNQNPKSSCVDTQTDTDSNNLLWMQVRFNGAVVYGRFSYYAELDGEVKKVQYSYDFSSSAIEITIPHFWDQAVFDPDFQILLDFRDDSCSTHSKSAFSRKFTKKK